MSLVSVGGSFAHAELHLRLSRFCSFPPHSRSELQLTLAVGSWRAPLSEDPIATMSGLKRWVGRSTSAFCAGWVQVSIKEASPTIC